MSLHKCNLTFPWRVSASRWGQRSQNTNGKLTGLQLLINRNINDTVWACKDVKLVATLIFLIIVTAVCIMIDRLQKWVKCNFPSPLIGIHGQPHWRLGVSGFTWFESTGKVRLPKCGNCSVPCIFTLLHYKMWYYSLKDNLQSVKNNLWGTPQGLRVVHLVDTVINLLYSLVCIYWTWLFRLLMRGSWFVSIYRIVVSPPTRSRGSRKVAFDSFL